jgi:heat shock protein HtpX
MILVGERWWGRWGLLTGFLLSLLFLFLVFNSLQRNNLKKMKARLVKGQDSYDLIERTRKWAEVLIIPTPDIYILPFQTATAFATSSPWGNASLALSEGILKKLNSDELDAVIAHQLCHIARQDSFAFAVASVFSEAFLVLAEFLDQFWLVNRTEKLSKWFGNRPFQFLMNPLAWFIIRLKVRERNYFENDDLAAQILPDKKLLATALWKLESLNQARPLLIPNCSSHLFIVNPTGLKEKHWFYNIHPRMNIRLKRLIGFEPI